MTQLAAWVHTPIARALGWTLVHFLWEGAVLAIALLAALRLLRGAPAGRRYTAACLTLAAMPVAFGITLAVAWMLRPTGASAAMAWAPVPLSDGPIAIPPARLSWRFLLDRLSWAVPAWFVGVAFFYVRGLAGWAAIRRLRRRGVCPPPAEWQARVDGLCQSLRILRPVALLESCLTETPVLIGYWRPVILLPLGCLTGMPAAQVECILLHELAHVVRRDYLVNLLQSLVEGLLFYHPAVWWVSRVVRVERENCCDDRVVEVTGDARAYAATLALLEHRRALAPALAASGGNLMKRIRRLTAEPRAPKPSVVPAGSAAALLVVFAAALTALPAKVPVRRQVPASMGAPALAMAVAEQTEPVAEQAQKELPNELPTPYRKWLTEDVAYIIPADERAAFLALTSDGERDNFIEQFWKRRDPTPGTEENEYREEHYRRIAYTNEHFAGTIAGWKTDRGRMYIVYGPPDELEDHTSGSAPGGYPYQQWKYRYIEGIGTNIIVEFVDRDGTSNFPMTKDPSVKEKENDQAAVKPDAERARRIAYANDHFGGSKTDRGQAYVRYGPPDSITTFGERVIEWTYYSIESLGKTARFLFADWDGKGEFHLAKDPAAPEDGAGQAARGAARKQAEKQLTESLERLRSLESQLAIAEQELQEEQGRRLSTAETVKQLNHLQSELQLARSQSDLANERIAANQAESARLEAERQQQRSANQSQMQEVAQLNRRLALANATIGNLEANRKTQQIELPTVRLEESKPGTIRVIVPLAPAGDHFHVVGYVRAPSGRIVQAFGSDVVGQPSFARSIPLLPGKYRLDVVYKNMDTGDTGKFTRELPVQ